MAGRSRLRWVAFAALIVLALSWRSLSELVTEYLWFADLGYSTVLWSTLGARVLLGGAAGLAAFAFVAVNLWFTGRARGKLSTGASLAMATLVGLAAAVAAQDRWMEVQQWLHAPDFGVTVPIYGKDVSFFVFTLPVIKMALAFMSVIAVITTVAIIVTYLLSGSLVGIGREASPGDAGAPGVDGEPFDVGSSGFGSGGPNRPGGRRGRLHITTTDPRAKIHICLVIALLMFLAGAGQLVNAWNLAYSHRGVVAGPSYSDVHATLPALRVMAVFWMLGGAVVIWSGFTKRSIGARAFALIVPLAVVGVSVLAVNVLPDLVQRVYVTSNELAAEEPYIANNIEMTRRAFGLDGIEQREYKVREGITAANLRNAQSTLDNVRLWDWDPLLRSFQQLQEMRLYYRFFDVDVDRYMIDGKQTQVMLAVRELDVGRLPAQAQTWVNRRLKYTHGYGVCASPVNVIGSDGLPSFVVRDIPAQAPQSMALDRPQVYFGELTNDWVIANTRSEEFDYPMGESNQYNNYDADSGVRIGNPIVRAMFATKFGDTRLLLSRDITANSRVLFARQILMRVRKIAPFLIYDSDPYAVVADGRLVWMINGFTTSTMYPMSERYGGGINYIRNSVKITIDAYTGEVDFYLVDEADPLAMAYSRVFPGLFKSADLMPQSIREHLRYPEDMFKVQSRMYADYHVDDPGVFYNNEDVWGIPRTTYSSDRSDEVSPYYVNMALPGTEALSFVLFTPYTPAHKDNMVAWLAVSSDVDTYGRLVAFKFGKQSIVFGPMQIEAQIDQDAEISSLLSLWNQSGSRVIRGNLLVYPIDGGILYVEPVFLAAHASELPQLKRVVVSDGTRVDIGETLEQALASLTGGRPGMAPGGTVAGAGAATGRVEVGGGDVSAADRALQLFHDAQAALREGDFAEFGRLQSQLEAVLGELAAAGAGGNDGNNI